MRNKIDFSSIKEHIEFRSKRYKNDVNIKVKWAVEAFYECNSYRQNPDPKSKSGVSIRTIGYSKSAGFHITVLTYIEDSQEKASTAFKSNSSDMLKYYKYSKNRKVEKWD
jgi:hypothetical protein